MNFLWTVLIILLVAVHAFLFVDFYRSKRSRLSKQQIPLISAFYIGPLFYFILTNHQLKRKQFMKNKRRFS